MLRVVSLVAILFALSAGVASSKLPGGFAGTEDTCASVFTEDAAACGGTYPRLVSVNTVSYSNGYYWCQWNWDGGPSASPRYYTYYSQQSNPC
jgi:hypothetical protein